MPVSDAEYAHNCLFVKQNKESKKLQIRLRPWLQQDRYTLPIAFMEALPKMFPSPNAPQRFSGFYFPLCPVPLQTFGILIADYTVQA